MAEGVAAVGLAGAIVQLVEFSAKIIKRLKEFDSATDKIPESFRVIKIQLPLITDTLSRIQAQTQAESTGAATSNAYSAVIDNSIEEVERLTKLLDKALPTRALSTFETRRKALQSLVCDKKVQKCIDKILGNIQILNLYQSTNCYQTIDHLRQGPLQSCSVSSKIASNFSFGLNIGDAPQIEQEAFIGRELELKQLDDWLGPLKSPFTQKIVAIAGMGGMGKTQLSLAFAKHYRHGYSSVFWLNAKDQATLKQSFVSLSEIILGRLPGSNICDAPNQDQVIHEVRQWFSQHENDQWLLLFDNYDDPNLPGVSSITGYDIRRYFPFKDQGSILITTRSRRLSFARELVLHKLDDTEQSMAILSHRSRRNMKDDPHAPRLVERLGGLPLAIVSAATYLSQTHESVEEYLEAYESCWHELSDNAEELLEYENRTLFSTWNLSLNRVRDRDPNTGELLRLLAYFGPHGIHYELFQPAALLHIPWLSSLLENKRRFQRALALLQEHSLIEVSATGYKLHNCVHDWTLQALNRDISKEYFWVAVHCIAMNVRSTLGKHYWKTNPVLVEHAIRLEHNRFLDILRAENSHKSWCIHRLAMLWVRDADYARAEQLNQLALSGMESDKEPDHDSILPMLHSLGYAYLGQEKRADAERVFQRILKISKKVPLSNERIVHNTVNGLGVIYLRRRRYEYAQEILEQALRGCEKLPESEKPVLLIAINNLGYALHKQGKTSEAWKMYQRALKGCEEVLGLDHPISLVTMRNLGELYKDKQNWSEAEAMYQRALVGFKSIFGPDRYSTITVIQDLAVLRYLQNMYDDAEPMYKQAIAGFEKVLGLEHRVPLTTISQLSILYHKRYQFRESEEMYRHVLERSTKKLGLDNSLTVGTTRLLADVCGMSDKIEEAEQLDSCYNIPHWSE